MAVAPEDAEAPDSAEGVSKPIHARRGKCKRRFGAIIGLEQETGHSVDTAACVGVFHYEAADLLKKRIGCHSRDLLVEEHEARENEQHPAQLPDHILVEGPLALRRPSV